MPKVYNIKHGGGPPDAIYIGRGTPYGNPYVIGVDGNRNEVCEKYEEMLKSKPKLIALIKKELKGKDLECWCKPKRCHGDILIKIANEVNDEE